jgi:hypothetical protein
LAEVGETVRGGWQQECRQLQLNFIEFQVFTRKGIDDIDTPFKYFPGPRQPVVEWFKHVWIADPIGPGTSFHRVFQINYESPYSSPHLRTPMLRPYILETVHCNRTTAGVWKDYKRVKQTCSQKYRKKSVREYIYI